MKKIAILFVIFQPLFLFSQTDSKNSGNIEKDTLYGIVSDSAGFISGDPEFVIITNDDVKLKIFPNPASGNTTLRIQLRAPQFLTIDLADVNGNVIKTISSQQFNGADQSVFIDARELKPGSYLVRVQTEGGNIMATALLKIQR